MTKSQAEELSLNHSIKAHPEEYVRKVRMSAIVVSLCEYGSLEDEHTQTQAQANTHV